MAVLVVEHQHTRRAGVLPRRVLVGRRSMNHLVLDDRAVSRMHAWIDGHGDAYALTDAGSRTGTRVNGQPVHGRHPLKAGDVITIGPASLTFLAGDQLPTGAPPIDLAAEPAIAAADRGVLFDCGGCGAPIWSSLDFVGHSGQCTYCHRTITVPAAVPVAPRQSHVTRLEGAATVRERSVRQKPLPEGRDSSNATAVQAGPAVRALVAPKSAPPAAPPRRAAPAAPRAKRKPAPAATCGVCQSAIGAFEERTSCPSCGLTFHAECWAENYGCSAYGCPQVDALKPPELAATEGEHTLAGATVGDGAADPEYAHGRHPIPWEFLLLAGSVVGVLLGAVTFGATSLVAGGGAAAYFARHRGRARGGVILAAVALAVVGVVGGAAVSYVLYFGGRRVG